MSYNNASILWLTANNKYLAANAIFLLVLFSFALFFIYLFRNHGRVKLFILLLIYHTVLSIAYYFWQPWPPYDTGTYYRMAVAGSSIYDFFGVGGDWVSLILYPLVKYVHLSFFSGFMLFNVIGFAGLVFFYVAVKSLLGPHENAIKLLNIVVFFPGISFWTGPISKESVVFLGITMIMYALIKFNKRIIFFLFGSACVTLIRPQIYVVIILALLLSLVFLAKTSFRQKLILVPLLLVLMVPTYNLLLQRVKMNSINIESAQNYIEARGDNWGGGSGVNMQNYNQLFKVFTYLYRPLFFDAHSVTMVIASLENLFYLIISLQMCSFKFYRFIKKEKALLISFNLFFFLIGAILLSNSEANLGTAARHKIMLMPALLALFLVYRAQTQPLPVKQNHAATPFMTDSPEKMS